MPLYEYRCETCQTCFDALRSIQRADDAPDCPDCGGTQVTRKLSVIAALIHEGALTVGPAAPRAGGCCGGTCGCGQR